MAFSALSSRMPMDIYDNCLHRDRNCVSGTCESAAGNSLTGLMSLTWITRFEHFQYLNCSEHSLSKHFWMNVNRACISSFTEEAFVICVYAHQAAFTLPEMLHTGGRDLHFHAS